MARDEGPEARPASIHTVDPEPVEPDDIDPDLLSPVEAATDVRWKVAAAVAAGGAIGGLARLGVVTALPQPRGGFPWAVLLVNVLGCLLIGVLMALVVGVWPPHDYLRPFLGTGILGGFTTFSTYTSDTRALLQDGHAGAAAAYLLGTLVLGLLAVLIGQLLVRRLVVDRARPR